MNLLWAVAVAFVIAWVLGYSVFHVTSSLIHLLLVLAVVAVVVQLFRGRSV